MTKPELHNETRADSKRLVDRGMDEFIGICKGIIFDGNVCQAEATNLLIWLNDNHEVATHWPADQVYATLTNALNDGAFDQDEEARILMMLVDITGVPQALIGGSNPSTQLPLCHPEPEIVFSGKVFVLTGNFSLGSRKEVVGIIELLGGEVVLKDLRLDTNYLVIGDIGSKAWMHSTHGRKIERAVQYRDQRKTGLSIVSEAHFMDCLRKIDFDAIAI